MGVYRLSHLNVSQNQLASLPFAIFSLPNLTVLRASRNQLYRLPESETDAWTCTKLKKLDVSRNKLVRLPARYFEELRYLREINVSHNDLEELPFNWGSTILVREKIQLEFVLRDCPLLGDIQSFSQPTRFVSSQSHVDLDSPGIGHESQSVDRNRVQRNASVETDRPDAQQQSNRSAAQSDVLEVRVVARIGPEF